MDQTSSDMFLTQIDKVQKWSLQRNYGHPTFIVKFSFMVCNRACVCVLFTLIFTISYSFFLRFVYENTTWRELVQ